MKPTKTHMGKINASTIFLGIVATHMIARAQMDLPRTRKHDPTDDERT